MTFEPFANIAYANLSTDGFSERGGLAALTAAGNSSNVTTTTLGLRTAASFMLGNSSAQVRGMLGWQHAFGDITPLASLALAGGSPFTVAGASIARNSALVEAGFDVRLSERVSLGATYTGQFASGAQDQAVRANVKHREEWVAAQVKERDASKAEIEELLNDRFKAETAADALRAEVARLTAERDEAREAVATVTATSLAVVACATVEQERDEAQNDAFEAKAQRDEMRAALRLCVDFIKAVKVSQHDLGGNSVWPNPIWRLKTEALAAASRVLHE